jgi:hypothetical protein
MVSFGFFLRFKSCSIRRASPSLGISFFATISSFSPKRFVVAVMAVQMLRAARVQIDIRTNIVATIGAAKNVNPSHYIKTARGEIRTPDQGLMSPLLYH